MTYIVIKDFPNNGRKAGERIEKLTPSIVKFLKKHGFIEEENRP